MLIRVVRMTSSAGFLSEPRPLHVAHTTLSAGFVTKPSLGDAAMFLSGTAVRAALSMPGATQRYGEPERADQSHHAAFSLAEKTQQSFRQACEQRPKLQRQWAAYLRCSSMGVDERVAEVLSRLDWDRQRSACIIQVCACRNHGWHSVAWNQGLTHRLRSGRPTPVMHRPPHRRPLQSPPHHCADKRAVGVRCSSAHAQRRQWW